MRSYLIRRLLLIVPTLFGVTFFVYVLTRVAPGGPIEQAMMRAQASETGGTMRGSGSSITPAQLKRLQAYYGYDKPIPVGYAQWLGRVVRGDLGSSFSYGGPVTSLLRDALPISLTYGAISLVITFGLSIPMGIVKAIRHRTVIDSTSSVLVFIGYAIPGYALGALLVVYLAARARWFPMGGFVSEDFADFTFWGKVTDFAHHAALPLLCYIVGGFAFTTLLTKNQLLDNLAADYVRTAVAKGVSFRRAVFRHAFRNSLIPLATHFANAIAGLVVGSLLIEIIFDISGMGLVFYNAINSRDSMVVMGVVFVEALMLLSANLLGDVLVALSDPRVRFK